MRLALPIGLSATIALVSGCSASEDRAADANAGETLETVATTDAANGANEAPAQSAVGIERIDSGPDLDAAFEAAYPVTRIEEVDYAPAELIIDGDRHILVSRGTAETIHALSGFLGIHYLAREGDGFRVTGGRPQAITGASFGAPPDYRLREDLFDGSLVIQSEGGGTWQGHTCAWATLTLLAEDEPVQLIEGILLAYDNGGSFGEPERLDAQIEPGDQPNTIHVTYSGDVERRLVYSLEGRELVASSSSAPPQRC